jgi:HK97 family phage major capsid protein
MADQKFSYRALIAALHTGTLRRSKSPELDAVQRHEERFGKPTTDEQHSARFSLRQLFGRALTTVTGGGGMLVGTDMGSYVPALQAASRVMQLGAQAIPASKANVTLPRGATSISTSFESGETTNITETEGTFGQIGTTPKLLTIFSKVSRQLLIQSNAGAIIQQEQAAAAGTALDASVIAGAGSNGAPLGILNTPGVGTFTGATLNYAALIAGQQAVSDANAILDPGSLGYLATPTVAGLLKQRFRSASASAEWPIWQGPLAGGDIEGVTAFATRNVPAGSMIFGDFSTIRIFLWDDVSIEVDPFSNFQTAQVGVRLVLPFDVALSHPASFAVATGIT